MTEGACAGHGRLHVGGCCVTRAWTPAQVFVFLQGRMRRACAVWGVGLPGRTCKTPFPIAPNLRPAPNC